MILGDTHTAVLREISEIFNKATPRARPPRVVPTESGATDLLPRVVSTELKNQQQPVIEQTKYKETIPCNEVNPMVTTLEVKTEEFQPVNPLQKPAIQTRPGKSTRPTQIQKPLMTPAENT